MPQITLQRNPTCYSVYSKKNFKSFVLLKFKTIFSQIFTSTYMLYVILMGFGSEIPNIGPWGIKVLSTF
jgi:hypothetical protein